MKFKDYMHQGFIHGDAEQRGMRVCAISPKGGLRHLCRRLPIEGGIAMTNLIVSVILVLIVGGAVFYIIRAKKSGAKCIGCPAGGKCSGSGSLPRKKLDGPVVCKKTLSIDGMHCEHCAASVEKAVSAVAGVSGAKVNLKKKNVTVSMDQPVDNALLAKAIEEAGFQPGEVTEKNGIFG